MRMSSRNKQTVPPRQPPKATHTPTPYKKNPIALVRPSNKGHIGGTINCLEVNRAQGERIVLGAHFLALLQSPLGMGESEDVVASGVGVHCCGVAT